jgi:CBS domain-containing protein
VNIADALATTPVSSLDLNRYVRTSPDTTVFDTIGTMCEAGRTAACVLDDDELVGIFTQRDVLLRAIGRPHTWDRPIGEEMTPAPRTMINDQSLAEGLGIMNDWWVRSVPVVDASGRLVGNLSFYVVMQTIANVLASLIADDAAAPEVQHGLTFVDFTGLKTNAPVTVTLDDTVDVAAHHMKARAIGSVLVLDDRENLVGVLTEYDLQMKVGIRHPDPSRIRVQDIMTTEPIALRARSPIAGAIAEMAEHGFSHVPLLGETGRPVGVASFRDVASYVESSLASLG